MGTRGLTCVVIDGAFKVAQYGQWDHYPSVQGIHVLNFLAHGHTDKADGDPLDLELFKKRVRACSWITEDQLRAALQQLELDYDKIREQKLVSKDQRTAEAKSTYGYLSRDRGAEILDLVMASETGLKLKDSSTFGGDSLFCEYAYVIDLDRNVFEVHAGFQKQAPPSTHRFASMPQDKDPEGKPSEYHPCRLLQTYHINNLPSREQFIKDLTPDEK